MAEYKIELLLKETNLTRDSEVLRKAGLERELAIIKEQTAQAEKARGIFKSAFSSGLDEGNIGAFTEKLREGVRSAMIDSLSTGLTETLFNLTGVGDTLGGVFQTAEQKLPIAIQNAFTVGGESSSNLLMQAFVTGAALFKESIDLALGQTQAITGTGAVGGVSGLSTIANKIDTLGTLGMDRTGYAKVGGKDVPVAPADYYKTQGIEKAVEKGTAKNSMFNMQNLGKAVGVGLLAFGLFGSGKSQDSQSQKYATADAFNGVSGTSDATTRSSTRAKMTNITIQNHFDLEGVSLTDRKVIETFADAIKVAEKQILDTLANESVSSGEY